MKLLTLIKNSVKKQDNSHLITKKVDAAVNGSGVEDRLAVQAEIESVMGSDAWKTLIEHGRGWNY